MLKKIPESTFESHPYNKEEIARLREAIRGHHLESAIIIASYLGLRREEVLGLRWKDIDLENQRVYIRNVCRLVGSKVEYVEKTKTKASNTSLAIIAPLKNYLVELKQKQALKPTELTSRHIAVIDRAIRAMYDEYFSVWDKTKPSRRRRISCPTIRSMREYLSEKEKGNESAMELFDVSDAQVKCVNDAEPGTGLIRFGNKIVPFSNEVNSDSALYKLFNTNFHEMVAGK